VTMSIAREWGSTPADRAIVFPCDRWLEHPDDVMYRAVAVDAPPPVVFRWLCQLRAAPYSYDWIDNWGRESPRTLTPGLDDLAVGQRVMIFDLVEFERDRHVTLRMRRDVPSLRTVGIVHEIERTFANGCARPGFRLVHYSLQANHAHLIVEAHDRDALGRGMKAIGARLARAVNRIAGRQGQVLADRYHHRVLPTPKEVHGALRYVLKTKFGGGPRMLKVGDQAPDFEVVDHNGNTVRLSDLRGKKVVLWFYPKADTPG